MTDRPKSSVSGSQVLFPSRSPSEPLSPNSKGGHQPYMGEVDIIALVRSLQRSAGVADCFRKGRADCDDVRCSWRSYCLSPQPIPQKPSKNASK